MVEMATYPSNSKLVRVFLFNERRLKNDQMP